MSGRALLLSGGMDSIALAFQGRPELAITIDYGQAPARGEIRAATAVASELNIEHHVLRTDCSAIGSGDLANRPAAVVAPNSEWWPFRNQLLVTLAAAHCLGLGLHELWIATVSTDCIHQDGTRQFVSLMSDLLQAQEGGLTLEAPAIEQTTEELIVSSGVPLELLAHAHSCHVAPLACGTCNGCGKYARIREIIGMLRSVGAE